MAAWLVLIVCCLNLERERESKRERGGERERERELAAWIVILLPVWCLCLSCVQLYDT